MRWIAAIVVFGACVVAQAQSGSADEIARLMTERKYPQAMQKITAALALKGAAAKSVNRYDLFMLKGECHLQTRAIGLANDAYANAAKEAGDDPSRAAIAHAYELLLKQSKAFAYTPKTAADKGRATPIDILDPESRKKAFLAMMADELAANQTKLDTAKAAKSLPPIAEAFKPLATAEGIELAATGEALKVTEIRRGLIEQSKKVVADALRALSKRLGEIDKDANTFVEFYQDTFDAFSRFARPIKEKAYKKKGLSDAQSKELQEMTVTCDKLGPALIELAGQLHAEEKAFDPFENEAGRIRKEVDRVLDTDYQRVYRELPKK